MKRMDLKRSRASRLGATSLYSSHRLVDSRTSPTLHSLQCTVTLLGLHSSHLPARILSPLICFDPCVRTLRSGWLACCEKRGTLDGKWHREVKPPWRPDLLAFFSPTNVLHVAKNILSGDGVWELK